MLQTRRDLQLSGSVPQCQEPPFWLIHPITFSRKPWPL